VHLRRDDPPAALAAAAAASSAVLIDVLDDRTLVAAGRLLWKEARQRRLFAIGSSGLEHALAAGWKADSLYDVPLAKPSLQPAGRLLVLSGSCSPLTANQVACAIARGFVPVRLDPAALVGGDGRQAAMDRAVARAAEALAEGRSAILYSAAAPEDVLPREAASRPGFREKLGSMSGLVLAGVLDRSDVRRVVVAGGDTSSHAGARLSIEALTFLCPLAPGAPLCRASSSDPRRDGLEIVFKGGQCGGDDFFSQVRGEQNV
jgi:uncharacterized protein YgbK (DUF1537 family)